MVRMKSLFVVMISLLTFPSFSQFSVGGGYTTLFQFGNNKPFVGLHAIGELPQNDEVSFYARMAYTFPQSSLRDSNTVATANDINENPYYVFVDQFEKYNYFTLDGGTRYYFINGFDEGFSLYGGSNIGLSISTVRFKYSDYDESKYQIDHQTYPAPDQKGTILGLMAGVSGGAKYTFAGRGTIYLDVNPSLMLFAMPSNNVAAMTSRYRQLIFNIGIGYRKEFY